MSKRYALLIGISDYYDEDITNLPKVENNIDRLYELLTDSHVGKFPEENVQKHPNIEFSEARTEIENFFRRGERSDILLLYFAGHGNVDSEGEGYLCLSDTVYGSNSLAIDKSYVDRCIQDCRSEKIVLIIDACKSGRWTQSVEPTTLQPLQIPTETKGHFVIASSSGRADAFTDNTFMGDSEYTVFSHYLIQGLETGHADIKNDYAIDPEELHRYLADNMRYAAQTPSSKKSRYQEGQLPLAIAYNQNMDESELEPLWYEVERLTPLQVIEEILDIEKSVGRSAKVILKKLYKIRSSSEKNIPNSFNLYEKINKYSEEVFEEYFVPPTTYPINIEWCLVCHNRNLSEPRLHLSRYLISNTMFNRFLLDSDGLTNVRWWETDSTIGERMRLRRKLQSLQFGGANHPRVNVSLIEAIIFCRWVRLKTGLNVDLPVVSERMDAVKRIKEDDEGLATYDKYPWGDAFIPKYCNFKGSGVNTTTPINYYEKYSKSMGYDFSPFGILDLCGNAWEWCYPIDGFGENGAITGGSWRSRVRQLHVDMVKYYGQNFRRDDIGFRLALLSLNHHDPIEEVLDGISLKTQRE